MERVKKLREHRKYMRLYKSTIQIQAFIRGRIARLWYLNRMRHKIEARAAVHIQRMERGRRDRKLARIERRRRDKSRAATTIQNAQRTKLARIAYSQLKQEKIAKMASIAIQTRIRGILSRIRVRAMRDIRNKTLAAIAIQSIIRMTLTKMNMARKREEIAEYKRMRNAMALKCQKVYRGHRGRVKTRLKLVERNKRMRRLNGAALMLQCMVRCRQARDEVRKCKADRLNRWIEDARKWQEMWSDEGGCWFYLNIETGVSQWEPSKEGYIKADLRLVLANGEIIEDPGQVGKTKKGEVKRCSECTERVAIRHCNECGDLFCTKCYKACHLTGNRKKHTWVATGPKDCSECEMKLAERMCVPCDEGFCDPCWRKVHSKGKRRFHPYSDVNEDGEVGSQIFTIGGEQVTDYDASYAQKRLESEKETLSATALMNSGLLSSTWTGGGEIEATTDGADLGYDPSTSDYATTAAPYAASPDSAAVGYTEPAEGEWTQCWDDNGYSYWYNNFTGTSQYEDPYAVAT